MGKHDLCSEGKQMRIFVDTICFWKWHFLWPYKITKHYQNRVSAGTREKPTCHFWLPTCHFGKGPRKGASLSVIHKAVFCWKHVYSVFSKTQLCKYKKIFFFGPDFDSATYTYMCFVGSISCPKFAFLEVKVQVLCFSFSVIFSKCSSFSKENVFQKTPPKHTIFIGQYLVQLGYAACLDQILTNAWNNNYELLMLDTIGSIFVVLIFTEPIVL